MADPTKNGSDTVQGFVTSTDLNLPTEPGVGGVAFNENTATSSTVSGSTATVSTATVSTATGLTPPPTVQICELDKIECIGFCKLLKISYQGAKAELRGAIQDEINRRHTLAGTDSLDGPALHAVVSEFSKERARGDFKPNKKREAEREAAREDEPAAEAATALAVPGTVDSVVSPKAPRKSGVTAKQVLKKMPSEPFSEDPEGNLHCDACSSTFSKGSIFTDRVVYHANSVRHTKKFAHWLTHKKGQAESEGGDETDRGGGGGVGEAGDGGDGDVGVGNDDAEVSRGNSSADSGRVSIGGTGGKRTRKEMNHYDFAGGSSSSSSSSSSPSSCSSSSSPSSSSPSVRAIKAEAMVVRLQNEVASLKGKLEVSEAKVARLTRLKKEVAAALKQEAEAAVANLEVMV